jgi:gas vesicle protein
MNKQVNSNEKMLAALLIGAAVSGALAILFAPNKGSVTRKKLFKKGADIKDNLQEQYDPLLKSQKELLAKIKA